MQICDTNKKTHPYQFLWVTIDCRREKKIRKKNSRTRISKESKTSQKQQFKGFQRLFP